MEQHRRLSPAQCSLRLPEECHADGLERSVTVQPCTSKWPHTSATGSATAAGKTKMGLHGDQDEEVPLLAGSQATKPTGSKQSGSSLYTSDDELAGPIVTGRQGARLGHCARLGYCAHH